MIKVTTLFLEKEKSFFLHKRDFVNKKSSLSEKFNFTFQTLKSLDQRASFYKTVKRHLI